LIRGVDYVGMDKDDQMRFNVACDIVVNQLIKDNSFKLPAGCLIPDSYNKIKLSDGVRSLVISDTNKKIAEEIYNEIIDFIQKQKKDGKGKGSGKGEKGEDGEFTYGNGEGRFDEHIREEKVEDGKDGEKGEKISEEERSQMEKEWMDRTQQALAVSRMKGDTPAGMERFVGKLHESEVNWKALLLRYIQSYIPTDFNYSYPSKKSISSGVYMPSTTKECIEIAVGIDVSGSIGQIELVEFLSEIIGIAKAFRGKIKMHLFTHETEVNDKYIVENGDVEKIMAMEIHGGGGTSHRQPMEYVNEEIKNCKLVVWFTDGCSDLNSIDFKKNRYDSIFIINKQGTEEQLKGKDSIVIKLK
jgi:predicted metal-dependent peptidase